jgi:deoxyadenosine/deoxycytidine kinase
MSIVLSLQGCMGVGKTTAVNYIRNNAPYVNISFEANLDVIEQIKSRELDKNIFEDYIEIQKLWIQNEIVRWEKAQKYNCSIMDFGAEEIEFYTLNYPKAIGVNWDVEDKLHNQLEELRKCMPDRILFLDASESILKSHKEKDKTRSRNFFEYYLKYLLPLKKEWFFQKKNVDILNVDNLNENEIGKQVKTWIDNCIDI